MRSRRALACLALLFLSACGGGIERSENVAPGPATADAVRIEAGDNVFDPETIEANAGETISIEVTNKGRRPHDFTIKELGLSTGVLQPGEIATATFAVPDEGVDYVCTLHRGMEGTIPVD
jgi:plastocyanin